MAEITDSTLAVAGAKGMGYGHSSEHELQEFAHLREAVSQTRADIRESIQNQGLSTVQQFAHVAEKACDAEKEAIKSGYEAKLQTLTSAKGVEDTIAATQKFLSEKLSSFEQNVDNRFCEVDKAILTQGYENRLATAGVLALVAAEGSKTRDQIEECCCEIKGVLASNKLKEVEDELQEARFDAIAAKFSNGSNGGGK